MKVFPLSVTLYLSLFLNQSNGFSSPSLTRVHRLVHSGEEGNSGTTQLYVSSSSHNKESGLASEHHSNDNEKNRNNPVTSNSSPHLFSSSDCDDVNTPPSLAFVMNSFASLKSGSDIRGQFVDHIRVGSIMDIPRAISNRPKSSPPPLTPFAAYCYGHAFATMLHGPAFLSNEETVVCIGRDPRPHGVRLADSFARGVESVEGCRAIYTGLATTPAMFEFCRKGKCQGSVMVTASHLPIDRNGFKFFTKDGGMTKTDIDILTQNAVMGAREWIDFGLIPPSSGEGTVTCSEWKDHMPLYKSTLRDAIVREVNLKDDSKLPLDGLKILLNAGNGAGYFFADVLSNLGADVSNSMNLNPDGTFPKDTGVPNPESKLMMEATTQACKECKADLGIMFDTDADRSGFVVPTSSNEYESLNRNRLIALLSVIFSATSPGCTIVTDSATSEGLSTFLRKDLNLRHYRYIRGYANVIGKARELTESGQALAEIAIETSGHCAMRENGYMDDGTYTAIKVIGLLARMKSSSSGECLSLLDSISNLQEMEEVSELRLEVLDGSQETTKKIYDFLYEAIQNGCTTFLDWHFDGDNLEGIRVRIGSEGSFFMMRRSLHDPIIIIHLESSSVDQARCDIVTPILNFIHSNQDPHNKITDTVDISFLENY